MQLRPCSVCCVFAFLALLLACACSDDASSGSGRDADVGLDVPADTTRGGDAGDADVSDVDTAEEVGPQADFGEACRANDDCSSSFCVAGRSGFVCTDRCGEGCPDLDGEPMTCRSVTNFGADEVSICMPSTASICEPCLDDRNCVDGLCVELPGGSVCGADCSTGSGCPEGTFCFTAVPGLGDLQAPQCLPDNLACDCSDESDGATRPCARGNLEGTRSCLGTETCDAGRGWVGCDAETPQPETCDGDDNDCNGAIDDGLTVGVPCDVAGEGVETVCPGILVCEGEDGLMCRGQVPEAEHCDLFDNDCNGSIDDGFVDDEGRYTLDAHCGVCGNDCATRFPEGYESECQVVEERALCVVTACPVGFTRIGLTTCVPLDSELCGACASDADCNDLVGDRCLDYPGGQRFCGRDCGPGSAFGSDCPAGYECDPGEQQCRLVTGSCSCEAGDLFELPCEVIPGCFGTQLCDDGTLDVCAGGQEVCDGADNDCNGEVDDPWLDADSGLYDAVAHCGRCFNDCDALFASPSLNTQGGICTVIADEAFCEPDCADDFVDVDGLAFNGCECAYVLDAGERDIPDVDGIDEDCDGIDGEVARGVFVAPNGDDETGDGTLEAPYATIGVGIAAATLGDRDHVYVAAGVYGDPVVLRDGVSVFGGYGPGFGGRDIAGNETAILGQRPAGETPGAVTAVAIATNETLFDGFTVVGFDETEPGASSYAIHVTDSDGHLLIRNNVVRAGGGGNGLRGVPGPSGTGATGALAATGEPSRQAAGAARSCVDNDDNVVDGGSGASFACLDWAGAAVSTDGAAGGSADCPFYDEGEPGGGDADAVIGGGPGRPVTSGGAGGLGGYSQQFVTYDIWVPVCYFCLVPREALATIDGRDGADGALGDDALPGAGCEATGGWVDADGEWVAGLPNGASPTDSSLGYGGAGLRAGPGSGGGGGGSGGGIEHCDPSEDATCPCDPNVLFDLCDCSESPADGSVERERLGSGGGGGGAGGCGGDGGTGGGPGGGSFGVFLVFSATPPSLPQIRGNTLLRGVGGTGGDGGPGGDGGAGGLGAAGAEAALGCTGAGGRGGDGGPGGAGGGGGGGCAGLSIGVYAYVGGGNVDLSAVRAQNDFPTGAGAGGRPGRGGPSTGLVGSDADDGLYEPVLPCGSDGEAACGEVL